MYIGHRAIARAHRIRGVLTGVAMAGRQRHSASVRRAFFCCFVTCAVAGTAAVRQTRYSIPEEMAKGSLVGDIGKDLGLNIEQLAKRSVRLVPRGKTQHFAFSLRDGCVYISEQIDREAICAHASPCLLHFELLAENPMSFYRIEVEVQDINDNAPSFQSNELMLEISEITAPGTRLSLPKASDPDVGVNSIKQYHLNHNKHFKIDKNMVTGENSQPELVLVNTLDREHVTVHHLTLTATDGGSPVRSGTMHIRVVVLDVNDNAPVFSQSVYRVTVMEDVAVGTLLTTVAATDADAGSYAEVAYSFRHHHTPLFKVNAKTGDIYMKGKLDYEVTKLHEVEIEAKDSGGLVGQSKLLIDVVDVNDNPPEMTITFLSSSVSEDCTPGTVIAILNVHDADSKENGEITCSIDEHLPFRLERSFDNYYSLVTDRTLDREEASQYSIKITAEDHGEPVLSTSHAVMLQIADINDNPPVFDRQFYKAYVLENNRQAASIYAVKATDRDSEQNSRISYSLITNIIDHAHSSSYISINSETGVIYALRPFDYEQLKKLEFHIKAQDGGSPPLSSNTTVMLHIVDQNDNFPQILYPSLPTDGSALAELAPRSSEPGYLIAKVVAIDADSGQNAWLSYQMLRSTDQGLFTVGLHSGEIKTARAFVEKDALRQILIVSVKDNGQPRLSATVTVTVLLADSMPAIFSDVLTLEPHTGTDSNLTLYLVIAVVFVSGLFLIMIMVLVGFKLRKWKLSKQSNSANKNSTCLTAPPYMGIDGVRAFLQAYCNDMTLAKNAANRNSTGYGGSNASSLTNTLSPNDWNMIVLHDGNIRKEGPAQQI